MTDLRALRPRGMPTRSVLRAGAALGAPTGPAGLRSGGGFASQSQSMLARTLASVKRLPRISAVLTEQEAFDFACAFLADGVWLATVAVMHEGISAPLVWGASGIAGTRIEWAGSSVDATYRRLFVASAGYPEAVGRDDTETVVTVPLGIPMLGVMRSESVAPMSDEESVFLRLVAILLGLSLASSSHLSPSGGPAAAAGCP